MFLGANPVRRKAKGRKQAFATYKQRGEWAELLFMTLAAERGFRVAKPWGDSAPYDVVVEREGRFLRVQVKCTDHWVDGGYVCPLHGFGERRYEVGEIDYLGCTWCRRMPGTSSPKGR